MANKNSENPIVGKQFQEYVKIVLEKKFNVDFNQEVAIPIGQPPRDHRFDLVNKDQTVVAECKCYTWTDSGNVPSAKLMGLDEALFYFSFLPKETKKLLCMKKSTTPDKSESLAEYYIRVHGHLLRDVEVCEISEADIIQAIGDPIRAKEYALNLIKHSLDSCGFVSEIRYDRKAGPYINIGDVGRVKHRAQFWFDLEKNVVFLWVGKEMSAWYSLSVNSKYKQPWEGNADKENKLMFPDIDTANEYIHKVADNKVR